MAEETIPETLASRLLRAALDRKVPPELDEHAWAAAARWAEVAQVGSYLHEAFSSALGPDSLPARALSPIRRRDSAVEMHRSQWVPHLLRALADAGAATIAFKGLGVAHRYYPAPDARPMADIDLLFRAGDFGAVQRAAKALGFSHRSDDPAVIEFEKDDYYLSAFLHPAHGLFEAHHGLYRDIPDPADREVCDAAGPGVIFGVPVRFCAPHHLWAILAVHLAISSPCSLWRWLLDLALMSRHPDHSANWPDVASFCGRHGLQVFAVATATMLEKHLEAGPPEDFTRGMVEALRPRERKAVAPIIQRGMAACSGDRLCGARRLSGRPTRGSRGMLGFLWPHPGAVCKDLNVRSDRPGFWRHRARHVGWRALRAVRSLL